MSEVTDKAAATINERLGGGFDGSAKFDIEGDGTVMVDSDGARSGDGDADVTLSADQATFEEILSGDLDATSAFMQGRLKVDGDMGTAMRLASALS